MLWYIHDFPQGSLVTNVYHPWLSGISRQPTELLTRITCFMMAREKNWSKKGKKTELQFFLSRFMDVITIFSPSLFNIPPNVLYSISGDASKWRRPPATSRRHFTIARLITGSSYLH